jgi:nucleoid-associated protein YgaU
MKANDQLALRRFRFAALMLLTGGALATWVPPAVTAAAAPRPTFAELLVAALAALGIALCGWLLLAVGLSVLAVGSSRLASTADMASRLLIPACWRRSVCWALGGVVAALPLAAAGASALPSGNDDTAGAPELSGLPFPDRPVGQLAPRHIVVAQGDTLWSIAAAQLVAPATDEHIAAAWPQWYRANRGVIGPDPDLILPDTLLRRPR